MYIFRLFKAEDPLTAIDARLLAEGALKIGRDPAADWVMIDPTCQISRDHLVAKIEDGRLVLHCLGSNGVFDDQSGERLPEGEDLAFDPPRSIRVGPYRLVAEQAPQAVAGAVGTANGTLLMTVPKIDRPEAHRHWAESPSTPTMTAGTMFEAFCEGAGIDAAQLSGEDPAAVLCRAGAMYRHMVLGVSDLIAERERVRGHYRLVLTTIGGADNNPFKWAPTQRLAIDLLVGGQESFLAGPVAVDASFREIKEHLSASYRGFQNSIRSAIATFGHEAIAKATEGQGSLLKGKPALYWEEASRRQSELAEELAGKPGALDRAFVEGYGDAAPKLEGSPR